jgi:dienelactone hydrolase
MKFWLLVGIFLMIVFHSFGQSPTFSEIKNQTDYPFLLYVPDSVPSAESPPIIIFLHGRSLSGTDLNLVKRYGVLDAIKRGKKIPAIVIAPQVKKSESWNPEKIANVLDYVQSTYKTDTSRVYVVGMSLGGYGTLAFAGKFPERVAAAVALCGGGNLKDADNLSKTNLWIQHGKLDKAVPYSESVKIHASIIAYNPTKEVNLTLYPKFGHGELAREFQKDTLYNWLFQFRLDGEVSELQKTDSSIATAEKEVEVATSPTKNSRPEKKSDPIIAPKKVYLVKKGDTLYSIARAANTSVNNLLKLNGIKEKSILKIGQKIKIR